MSALRYIGIDPLNDWLPGVPARDLSAAEAERWPQAASSSLYEPMDESAFKIKFLGNPAAESTDALGAAPDEDVEPSA